jgi:hypothetical protein|tara:strand:- start:1115 stop:1375 length:261 start_codon:yes stop_codon:yes gene_type:complete
METMNYKEIERTGNIAIKWIMQDVDRNAGRIVRGCLADFMHYKLREDGFYMTNYKEILEEVRDTWEVPPQVGVRIEKAIKSLQHES